MTTLRRATWADHMIVVDDLNEVWPWLISLTDKHGDPLNVIINKEVAWSASDATPETYDQQHVSFIATVRFTISDEETT